MKDNVPVKKNAKNAISALSKWIGAMSIFASTLEVLNIGRFLEVVLSVSAPFASGIEISFIIAFSIIVELIGRKKLDKKEENNEL